MSQLPQPINACGLVTRAEAEAVLGETVEEPLCDVFWRPDEQTLVMTCVYTTVAGQMVKGVSVLVGKAVTAAAAAAIFADLRAQAGALLQPLPAIGDEAYWNSLSGQVYALKGPAWLIISADSADGLNSAESARTLALNAVGRL